MICARRTKGWTVVKIWWLAPDLGWDGLGDGNETSNIFVVALSLRGA